LLLYQLLILLYWYISTTTDISINSKCWYQQFEWITDITKSNYWYQQLELDQHEIIDINYLNDW